MLTQSAQMFPSISTKNDMKITIPNQQPPPDNAESRTNFSCSKLQTRLTLLRLQAQDRVITWENYGYSLFAECTLYVECVDHAASVIHCLTAAGNARQVAFADVQDVIPASNRVTIVPPAETWTLHGCDPAYLGQPVPAIAVMVNAHSRVKGLVLPKFPGARPGEHLHLACGEELHGKSDQQLIHALPVSGFNAKTRVSPDLERSRGLRTAANRISNWLAGICRGTPAAAPLDPGLHQRGGSLIEKKADDTHAG